MNEQATVDLKPVKSSQIASIGYHAESKTLVVKFKNNAMYSYSDVPEKIFNELMAAESVGKYFHARVKSIFKYQKLS